MALLAASSLSSLSLRCAQAPPLPSGCHTSRVSSHASAGLPALPSLSSSPCEATLSRQHVALGGSALAGAVFASLASAESAMAAQEIMSLAADDSRGLVLLVTLVPAIAWVLFNILQPALIQINRMRSAKGLAVGLGLGAAASLLASRADAAQELASIGADNDSRGLLLLIVLGPAIGWVLFNILQPALNQFKNMRSKGLVGAVGLGAAATSALLLAPNADAAVQELATLADKDSRGLLLLGILIPAVGWVLFNILQPALSQLDKMKTSKGVVGGALGLGATSALLIGAGQADAAVQELAKLAENDSRGTLLLGVLIPAVGWVLFNILQPALSQVDRMRAQK